MGSCFSRKPRLHELAKTGNHSELMQEILRFPGLIDEKNSFGKAPIHIACEFNQPEIVKVLINSGARKDLTTGATIMCTPLHVCAEHGSKDAANVLINMKADINAQDVYGWTPLHYACDKRHPETALVLIDKGADVNAVNKSKETALHFAAKSGLTGVGEVLIQKRANVNAMDADVWTPLHTACKWNRLEMAVLLARSGADLNAVDEVTRVTIFVLQGHSFFICSYYVFLLKICSFLE